MITAGEARALLAYDPETGALTWRVDRPPRAKSGAAAGYDAGHGYRKVSIGGRRYYAHRIAVLLVTGDWPTGVVDHLNGLRSDNRWCNLRVVTQRENLRNLHPELPDQSKPKQGKPVGPSIAAVARAVGIPQPTLHWRMHQRGMSLAQAIAYRRSGSY